MPTFAGRVVGAGLIALLVLPVHSADSAFDDSYARRVCGGAAPPTHPTVRELCLEMMSVGQWYTSELEALGVREPGREVKVAPDHPLYREVRRLGVEVDLRAQELMVLMARVGGSGSKEEKRSLRGLEATLEELRSNADAMPMLDAILDGAGAEGSSKGSTTMPLSSQRKPMGGSDSGGSENSGGDRGSSGGEGDGTPTPVQKRLAALDADALVAEAEATGVPLSELIQKKRREEAGTRATGGSKKEKKTKKKTKKKKQQTPDTKTKTEL